MNLIKFFLAEPTISISAKEIAVLDAIDVFGHRGASCADLQEKILEQTSKEPRIATLYHLLTDLERKGLIEPFESVQHERGGRPRQMFRVTESGRRAISLGEAMAYNQGHTVPA